MRTFDEAAVLRRSAPSTRPAGASRRRRPASRGVTRPVLDRHGHRADGAVAAHRQAAAGLDEQDGDVAIVARRRVEDRARHHVMAARLEHEAGADPVVARR